MDDAESDDAQLDPDKLYQRVISHGKNSRTITGESNTKHTALLTQLKTLQAQMTLKKRSRPRLHYS